MKTRYTKLQQFGVMTLLAITMLSSGCASTDSSLARVQDSGTLRIGLDPTYPPFEVADDTGTTGLDVDLGTNLAAEMGVEPSFTYFGYDGLYDALLTDQVDVLISALVISPERTRDFAYSRPYYDAGQVLIVPVDSAIAAQSDLPGHTLAVELGAFGHVEALALEQTMSGLIVQPFPSSDEALQAVADGVADAALVDSISGRLFLKSVNTANPVLKLLPQSISSEPFAVVVRIEDEELLSQIDAELAAMETDGRLQELVNRWLGP